MVAMRLPLDLKPFTWLWHTISSSRMLCHILFKYLKLGKTCYVLVLGSVEDDFFFSSLDILKYRVHDKLDPHLLWLRRCMNNNSSYWLVPYKKMIKFWENENKLYGHVKCVLYP
jgi:hypothetical protein